ncbi:uncharacterized protein BDR25DRAFT_253517 [Lindgomyces ingoldianus]|uniref:Uncharacterized protein n=1 Tax=Lindgomyces ingoldianus TaxID=673940 RepID=A0ACB6RA14_9PLEO|nr:uncharacterized protein BDR25DRAFT_253517 [Lindgomyces ingoldianus]KAF2475890.1 hypothetical protein BDR25DRAFT_253517 [Lindgomyces ingoldianus]
MTEQTLNLPQVIVFLLLTVLVVRWYLAKPSSTRPPSQNRSVRVTPAQIDQIAQMFPQLGRREIAWDLQRNGGNVAATTERVLSGRALEAPPASFNPPAPRSNPTSRTATPPVKPAQSDLITRYNLASKLAAVPGTSTSEPTSKQKTWSQDRNERQANLQRRREEMILAARRKMEEKDKARASGASS